MDYIPSTKMIRCIFLLVSMLSFSPISRADQPADYATVAKIDLTGPFHTKTRWEFVVAQEPDNEMAAGNLHFCFVHDSKPLCPDVKIHFNCEDYLDRKPVCPGKGTDDYSGAYYNHFDEMFIFNPKNSLLPSLFVVIVSGNWGGPGMPLGPIIWAYHKNTDTFDEIFAGWRSGNGGREMRLVTSGPLSGYILANDQTEHSPYPYLIDVYALSNSEHYARVLQYKSKTKYMDGNPLLVLDEEMPEIERRLGMWKPGDPLPVPAAMPDRCTTLALEDGVEHCH